MAESAVETNRALPSPQPARNPMTSFTLPESEQPKANTTMIATPATKVRLVPNLWETHAENSITNAVTNR